MNYVQIFKKFFSNHKLLFWFGHTFFWIIIWINKLITNPHTTESLIEFILLIFVIGDGYLLTFCLRVIYKKYIWHKVKIGYLVGWVFLCSYITTLVWYVIIMVTYYLLNNEPLMFYLYTTLRWTTVNFTIILLWSSLYFAYKIWEEWTEHKYQLEKERTLLRTSQLEMLKYQINPHFLFNTLSSLRGLISVNQEKAREMVTEISEFLRYSLHEGINNEVKLINEMEIIKLYLNIEQVRYGENLIVEFDIPDETFNFKLPIFLIHPLVENAIKHGMHSSKMPLKIYISSALKNNTLILKVKNTGNWIENNNEESNKTGIGLQNIKKRLENAFPNNYLFEIIKEQDFVELVIKLKYE
ncbi:MAG: histidine kinase [bacterium]